MKKTAIRMITAILVLCCIASLSFSVYATTTITIDGTHSATMTRTGTGTTSKTVNTGATCWHNVGTTSYINVSTTKTVTATGFPTVYVSYFVQAGNSEGLPRSKGISLSGTAVVAANLSSGTYEATATINGNRGTWAVITNSPTSFSGAGECSRGVNADSGTVTYAPSGTTITFKARFVSSNPIN